eukprot:CAMPEP_0197523496 /NCGR_PEP_ID=MMETSP1318-20131121/8406_1 /TAXON_ID=552666 /ORGANISM="Partenskyella glossopodia, Strain RCC365" /LENGTH=498 /DNA_ID=CAMNT_0043076203 /DNA_START=117 /DNA_END=1610 /DNA_ORIENTATION=-
MGVDKRRVPKKKQNKYRRRSSRKIKASCSKGDSNSQNVAVIPECKGLPPPPDFSLPPPPKFEEKKKSKSSSIKVKVKLWVWESDSADNKQGKITTIAATKKDASRSEKNDEVFEVFNNSDNIDVVGCMMCGSGKKYKHQVVRTEFYQNIDIKKLELQLRKKGVADSKKKMQQKLGPQSMRPFKHTTVSDKDIDKIVIERLHIRGASGGAPQHKIDCFKQMLVNERRHCGEYAVFYHSFSHSLILYEIHAAIAAHIFGYESDVPLPRLLLEPFLLTPDGKALKNNHSRKWRNTDHHPDFRSAGICGTTSLLANDTEAAPIQQWHNGYHIGGLQGFLDRLLDHADLKGAKSKILEVTGKYGVNLNRQHGFGHGYGHPRNNGYIGNRGNLLQIFIRRDIVDDYVYPSMPMGVWDRNRKKISDQVNANCPIEGQVRICVHPLVFTLSELVKTYVYSCDKKFHDSRTKLQKELRALIRKELGSCKNRSKCVEGLKRKVKHMSW